MRHEACVAGISSAPLQSPAPSLRAVGAHADDGWASLRDVPGLSLEVYGDRDKVHWKYAVDKWEVEYHVASTTAGTQRNLTTQVERTTRWFPGSGIRPARAPEGTVGLAESGKAAVQVLLEKAGLSENSPQFQNLGAKTLDDFNMLKDEDLMIMVFGLVQFRRFRNLVAHSGLNVEVTRTSASAIPCVSANSGGQAVDGDSTGSVSGGNGWLGVAGVIPTAVLQCFGKGPSSCFFHGEREAFQSQVFVFTVCPEGYPCVENRQPGGGLALLKPHILQCQ